MEEEWVEGEEVRWRRPRRRRKGGGGKGDLMTLFVEATVIAA